MVALNAIVVVSGGIGLIGAIFRHSTVGGSNLAYEPRVMTLAAIGIFALAGFAYLTWLKNGKDANRHIPHALKLATFPGTLAIGLSMLLIPALLAPAFAPTIWLALLVLIALLSIVLILNPKTRRPFIK